MCLLVLINDLSTKFFKKKEIVREGVWRCDINEQKILIPSLANLTEGKFKNHESKHYNAILNLLTKDRLGTS